MHEPSRSVRTLQHNITVGLLVLCGPAAGRSATPNEVWNSSFNKEVLSMFKKWTHVKLCNVRKKYGRKSHLEIQNTDETEIRAFLGLLFYSTVFKFNCEHANFLFATHGTGWELFRLVVS